MSEEKFSNQDSLIGLKVDAGRYEIIKLIGEGGMGRVFQARQISMNRMVALKILRAQLASDESLLLRFQQEALSVSRLRHPNTITIFDYGRTEDGYLFMAMELLGGRSLFSLLRHQERIPLNRALHYMDQVCGAVAEAHSLGIIHRDLKPENIQIDEVANDPDFAKVLDFGIAKIVHGDGEEVGGKTLTMAGAIFGTPHYMSPEQVHGLKVDHRTDIYSLGVILYEILAGHPPFDGATPMAVMMAQASKPPPDIRDVPEAQVTDSVAELINDCLAKERDDRVSTVRDLIDRIHAIQYEIGEITSTSRAMGSLLSSPPRDRPSGNVRPKTTPAPRIDEADARGTPEHKGQLATVPPTGIDSGELEALGRGGNGKWIAIAAALLVAGLAVALWPGDTPGDPKPKQPMAAKGPADAQAPVKLALGTSIEYELVSDPAGATVYLGEMALGATPLKKSFPPGEKKTLRLALEGYEDSTQLLPGSGDPRQTFNIKMVASEAPAPRKAWFKIESKPAGAAVYAGEEKIGVTPFDWNPEVSADPVELRFKKAGFRERSEKVALAAAGPDPTAVKVGLRRSRVGRPKPKPNGHKKPKPKKPKPKKPKPKKPKPKPTYEKL